MALFLASGSNNSLVSNTGLLVVGGSVFAADSAAVNEVD